MPVGFGRDPVDEPGVVVTASGAVLFKLGSAPPPDEELLSGYVAFYAPGENTFVIQMRANVGNPGGSPDYTTGTLITD